MCAQAAVKFIVRRSSWDQWGKDKSDIGEMDRTLRETLRLKTTTDINGELIATVGSLEKLLRMSDEFGELIITEKNDMPCIEIYDCLREG